MPSQKFKRRIVIGLTGSFGSGKSTVARIFKSYGAEVIDADKLAHQCLKSGSPVYKKIIRLFGRGTLKENKTIDRKKLGQIVFNRQALLRQLNHLVHPQAIRMIRARIKRARAKLIIVDAPLLIEAGLRKTVDNLIVVRIKRQVQIKRIQKKFCLTREEILKRIQSQIPLSVKARLADFVIDNNGSLKKTRKQVRKIWISLVRQRIMADSGSIRPLSIAGSLRRQLWKN